MLYASKSRVARRGIPADKLEFEFPMYKNPAFVRKRDFDVSIRIGWA